MADFPKPTLADWREKAQAELRDKPLDDLVWHTPEGIAVKPLYTREDDGPRVGSDLPGFVPYLRGPRSTMYANRPWTIRQYAGFSTAEESNAFYRKALESGQAGLSVAFDLATHRGYDSDHPRVEGDVGKAGVAIDSVEDMKILFDGIPLDRVSVSMTMNGAVLPVLARYIVAAEEQGVGLRNSPAPFRTTSSKSSWCATPTSTRPNRSMRIVADIIGYTAEKCRASTRSRSPAITCRRRARRWCKNSPTPLPTVWSTSSRARVRSGCRRVCAPLSLLLCIGMNFFMEVAKLRAARFLWAELMQRFSPKDPRSLSLRTHCQTSGVSLTEQDPHNNVVRTAYEAMAAVLGGTQSLHTNAFDEALALPSELSSRIARNTQLILAEETGITQVVDPLGGSHYVESLTDSLIEEARKLIEEVEQVGGMTKAVAQGLPKLRIEESAAKKQARIDRGEEVVVGVNKYRLGSADEIDLLEVDNKKVRAQQIERLEAVRKSRDEAAVATALEALREGARVDGNLLALSVDAMRVRATVGEVSAALEDSFTRHRAQTMAISGVYGDAFEGDDSFAQARESADRFATRVGRRPRILVAKLGQDGHDRGAKVIATAMADIGFDVDIGPLFATPEEAARQAIENDVHVVGISSQAAGHKTLVPQLIEALRAEGGGDIVVVVGGVIPPKDYDFLVKAGVGEIFGPGSNIVDAAGRILALLGDNRAAA